MCVCVCARLAWPRLHHHVHHGGRDDAPRLLCACLQGEGGGGQGGGGGGGRGGEGGGGGGTHTSTHTIFSPPPPPPSSSFGQTTRRKRAILQTDGRAKTASNWSSGEYRQTDRQLCCPRYGLLVRTFWPWPGIRPKRADHASSFHEHEVSKREELLGIIMQKRLFTCCALQAPLWKVNNSFLIHGLWILGARAITHKWQHRERKAPPVCLFTFHDELINLSALTFFSFSSERSSNF